MWLSSGKFTPVTKINIIGAGISGLLLGHYFLKKKIPFTIWETTNNVGGKLTSISTAKGLIEKSANAIILDANVFDLTEELNLKILYPREKLHRWIDANTWISSKKILFHLFTCLIFRGFKRFKVNKKQNLEDFFTPLMKKSWSHNILSAITRGIYAKNSYDLTLDALFSAKFLDSLKNKSLNYFSFFNQYRKYRKKLVPKKSRDFQAGSISFKFGMQELVDALSQELKNYIQLNTPPEKIQEIVSKEPCVICTTPNQASQIFSKLDPKLSQLLQTVPMEDITSTTVFTNSPVKKLEHSFGVLCIPSIALSFYGILAQSEIFAHRTKSKDIHSYTLIGPIHSQVTILKDFFDYTGLDASNVLEVHSFDWIHAIPIYNETRQIKIQKIQDHLMEQKNACALFGNYIEAIGLKDLVRGAKDLAQLLSHSK